MIEDFPPFYTRQPSEATWAEQKQQWSGSIMERSSRGKVWILDSKGTVILTNADNDEDTSTKPITNGDNLFHNTTINRKLDTSSITEILQQMHHNGLLYPIHGTHNTNTNRSITSSIVGSGRSRRLKDTASTSEYLVLWNTVDQWASVLLEWVERTGQLGTVLTLYELCKVNGEQFDGMPMELMKLCVEALGKRGRGVVMRDEFRAIVGVKVL